MIHGVVDMFQEAEQRILSLAEGDGGVLKIAAFCCTGSLPYESRA